MSAHKTESGPVGSITIWPFHERLWGVAALYHAGCVDHEDFTPCGMIATVGELVEEHLRTEHEAGR